MLKICLTGGPCSGKSSAYSILESTLSARGYHVFLCPESATELILNGIRPSENISLLDFQNFVLDKQLSKEKLYDEISKYYDESKIVIFYDRGILDQLAYVDRSSFEDMLKKRGLTIADTYNKYDAILHLVTAADGAEKFYVWNNPLTDSIGNNAARSESPEEAIIKDKKTLEAWIGHPRLRIFDNQKDFNSKIQNVLEEVFSLLGEPVPREIERKFLIKMPTVDEITKAGCCSVSNIIQTYLNRKNPKIERRVRQRGDKKNGYTFYYTEKTKISDKERIEVEKVISQSEYICYLSEADTSLHQISKKRYCFVHNRKYFELDIYPFSNEYAILEIELNKIDEEFEIPDYINVIKEVTEDESYKNYSLAKSLKL